MTCVAVTRNGRGRALRLPSLAAARLCPLVQLGDVVAESGRELLRAYGRQDAPEMAALLPEGRERSALREAAERWRDGDEAHQEAAEQVAEDSWRALVAAAAAPPSDPAEIVAAIVEDRRAIEGLTLRARAQESRMSSTATAAKPAAAKPATGAEAPGGAAAAVAAARAARIDQNSVITLGKDPQGKKYGADNNPRRAGSACHGRFALYRDGMTVAEARKHGVAVTDIRSDSAEGYITLAAPAAKSA